MDALGRRDVDTGTGYGRPRPTHLRELTEVGPGTPVGEPIDDTSFRIYTAGRVRRAGDLARVRSRLKGKLWEELTEAEHQRFPGDYEAQVGQGPITMRSEEHLVSSDRGVSLVRRILRRQLEAVAEGRDPIGVGFDAAAAPTRLEAGNFLLDR